jgi:hypothetical protein
MGYAAADVYNQPEEFGLEIVGTASWDADDYGFDFTVVWRDPASGEMFFATDSGCSCPIPFEDYRSRESLTPLERVQQLIDYTDSRLADGPDERVSVQEWNRMQASAGELIRKVRALWAPRAEDPVVFWG